jgi:anti-anti-sigma factor
VRGDIDDENIAHFESLLSAAAAPATARLTVDLTECEYINCRVITALILAARAHPGDFAVKVRASGSVFKIFEVTGLLNHGGSVRVERG